MTLDTHLLAALGTDSLTVNELAEEVGRTPASVRTALDRLRREGVVDRIHVFPFRYKLANEREGN